MGYKQKAYNTECAAFARALESASRRQTTPERITNFTDAQAAIRRIASEEPGVGQQYAVQARKHIAMLPKAALDIIIEIRRYQSHNGVAGNEKADERVKIVAEEPDARGVEWLCFLGQAEARANGSLQCAATARTADRKRTVHNLAMI